MSQTVVDKNTLMIRWEGELEYVVLMQNNCVCLFGCMNGLKVEMITLNIKMI